MSLINAQAAHYIIYKQAQAAHYTSILYNSLYSFISPKISALTLFLLNSTLAAGIYGLANRAFKRVFHEGFFDVQRPRRMAFRTLAVIQTQVDSLDSAVRRESVRTSGD